MWKVLIADDEPKIRQGLKNTLESFGLPIQVCAEARNGLEALEKAGEYQPDILLVDICMPKLSGIEFLQKIRDLKLDCKVIIISGFNEFSYAQQVIPLGVSSYLLKPIPEDTLRNEVMKVTESLEKERKNRNYHDLMKRQITRNSPYLRDVFFRSWLDGELSENEIRVQMELLGIHFSDVVTMVVLSVHTDLSGNTIKSEEQEEVYKASMEKKIREILGKERQIYVFLNRIRDVVGIIDGYCRETERIHEEIYQEINEIAGGRCCVQIRNCAKEELPKNHEQLLNSARKIMECRPIVSQARKYIYSHYGERELDLTQVAADIGCNPSYLSRIMKQELGISFKDYLTMMRIKQAIHLMHDSSFSLNQIAEKVGYSNQHYFSAAFKNVQGVSPSEYRRSMTQDKKGV